MAKTDADVVKFIPLADIVKTERTPNDTLLVYGRVAGETKDLDGQGLDLKWVGKALEDWMSTGANMREMHQPVAAGVGQELEFKPGSADYWLLSEAVDPTTVTKIEKKVLTGLSVGVKGPKYVKDPRFPNGRMVDGTVVEVSYADRACDPLNNKLVLKAAGDGDAELVAAEGAHVVTDEVDLAKVVEPDAAKKDYSTKQRIAAAKSGHAIPVKNDKGEVTGGVFPIYTCDDVKNARSLAHNSDVAGKDAHIAKWAKKLGCDDETSGSAKLTIADYVKMLGPDVGKSAWSAAYAGETVGRLRALRDQLGYPPADSDVILASVVDALLSLAWQDEADAVDDAGGNGISDMVLCAVNPDVGKRTFYSTAEKTRIMDALQSIFTQVKEAFPEFSPPAEMSAAIEGAEAGENDADADDQTHSTDETTSPGLSMSDDDIEGSSNVAGASKVVDTDDPDGEDAADVSKLAMTDEGKAALADVFKGVIAEQLPEVIKTELPEAVKSAFGERFEALEADVKKIAEQPAEPKVDLHVVDRTSAANEITDSVSKVDALKAALVDAETKGEQENDPMLKRGYAAKAEQIKGRLAEIS